MRFLHDDELHGVTFLLAAMDVASAVTISNCYRGHRHQAFLRFLNYIQENLPGGFDVHLVANGFVNVFLAEDTSFR